jgi:hypothetical protein
VLSMLTAGSRAVPGGTTEGALVMNLSPKEEACEIMMPDWPSGSRRVWLHDVSPARAMPGRASVRVSRHPNRYPAAAGAFGHAHDDQYLSSMPGYGRKVAEARRTGFLPALRDGASARDLR